MRNMDQINHSHHSVLRERIVEHVFVGDILRTLWRRGLTDVEVLRSEFDAHGYDLVMVRGRIIRHIQLKTILENGKAADVKVSLKLADQPSGCVIWIVIDKDLQFKSYLWFGGLPGLPLPDIRDLKVAKHTKGDAAGIKAERIHHRIVKRNHFKALQSTEEVLMKLFGCLDTDAGPENSTAALNTFSRTS
jgi:hypothetical protein